MTVRQHWICAGIALAALYVGLFAGRLGEKHAADRWYARQYTTTMHIDSRRCATSTIVVSWPGGETQLFCDKEPKP